jgi:DNA-binding beta-propeller fold protein YncE
VDSAGDVYVVDEQNYRVQKFDSSGEFCAKWNVNGHFVTPAQIAVSSSGHVYVSVSKGESHSIQVFESSGKFLVEWGPSGTWSGGFDLPSGVVVDQQSNLYVVDKGNARIQRFDSSGEFVLEWGRLGDGDGEFSRPCGAAIDPLGNVYVLDTQNQRVQKFDSSGVLLMKWGHPGPGDGAFGGVTTADGGPVGIAADSSGKIYVADSQNCRVQRFDSVGQFLTKWGAPGSEDGQFRYPCGIAADSLENVYVADTDNNRIQKFDSSGNFLLKWGSVGDGDGEFVRPYGVAVDSSGNVFVADTWNYRIQKFDSEGRFLGKWGFRGDGEGAFGSMRQNLGGPYSLCVDSSGTVYVADSYNHRIQRFAPAFGMRKISGPIEAPVIEWHSEANRNYRTWVSDDSLNWLSASEALPASGNGVNLWTDDGLHALGPPGESLLRFYRIELLP